MDEASNLGPHSTVSSGLPPQLRRLMACGGAGLPQMVTSCPIDSKTLSWRNRRGLDVLISTTGLVVSASAHGVRPWRRSAARKKFTMSGCWEVGRRGAGVARTTRLVQVQTLHGAQHQTFTWTRSVACVAAEAAVYLRR